MHAHSGHQNKITDNRIWVKGYTQEMQRRKKTQKLPISTQNIQPH